MLVVPLSLLVARHSPTLPPIMSRLHNLLRKKKKPDKCGFCHAVIAKDETHSGVFYTVPEEEGGTIHQVTGYRCLRQSTAVVQP